MTPFDPNMTPEERMLADGLPPATVFRPKRPDDDHARAANDTDDKPRKKGKARARPAADPRDLDGFDLTEDGVALAFVAKHGEDLRYCHHAGSWFRWNGAIWQKDETHVAFSWARAVCREIAHGGDDRVRTTLARAAAAAAVERFAQRDQRLAVTSTTWDRDPFLLGTPGGTVDLKTGKLRPASRSDFITKTTPVAPTETADCPLWLSFLAEATGGDQALIDFLQRLAGYLLTGDVTEEMLTFIYGPGGNGKGTFLSAITAIFGTYFTNMPIEAFTAGAHLRLEYYRAQMLGARLVTASEPEAGAVWAESQLKEISGNETDISARHPSGKPFNFRPQFKVVIVGNYAPRLKGRTPSMERRLRVIPFTRTPANRDLDLKERLRPEYPAILR
jgi:putative DNA primase/helicase